MKKSAFKMTEEELKMWLALRKKCHTIETKKGKPDRKRKHKKDWSND